MGEHRQGNLCIQGKSHWQPRDRKITSAGSSNSGITRNGHFYSGTSKSNCHLFFKVWINIIPKPGQYLVNFREFFPACFSCEDLLNEVINSYPFPKCDMTNHPITFQLFSLKVIPSKKKLQWESYNHAKNDVQKGCAMQLNEITLRHISHWSMHWELK